MSHKRQRTENGEDAVDHTSYQERGGFHITFGLFGSIALSKGALQAFPTSLITVTLLGDGIVEHTLYLPLDRGHKSFPELIQNIYVMGAPLHLPAKGVQFDLFVKLPGFFVETTISIMKAVHRKAIEPLLQRITYRSCTRDFINMPVDIERYISDLVPFEFARRGIHVVVEKLQKRSVKRRDVDLSRLFPLTGEDLMRGSLMNQPRKVIGAYMLSANKKSPFPFKHGDHAYEFSWTDLDADGYAGVTVTQLYAGCCYDGRENIERFVLLPHSETDYIAEFKGGNMVYSPGKYGEALLGDVLTDEDPPFLLLHGFSVRVLNLTHQDLDGACLLVSENESLPFCQYYCEHADRDDVSTIPWHFDLEESPEWALHSDGQPPLP